MMEQVVLLDNQYEEIGVKDKLQAHVDGNLHRAISVFIFNSKGEMLIQKRNKNKYHCGSLWTNTCCSHPRQGESFFHAANRRVFEEMGVKAELRFVFDFYYKKSFDNGLTENEYDHVFIGNYDGRVNADFNEAEDWKWVDTDWLINDLFENPENYTYWFKKVCRKVVESV
ncbi:isopentenyl-diphosphate Delta-isomerase [Candidatus Pacearchaeota archaeon]|nr:isopentenyl-diphosphate Delta-isomerase [Candidatus Pacearchaeota archaeon]